MSEGRRIESQERRNRDVPRSRTGNGAVELGGVEHHVDVVGQFWWEVDVAVNAILQDLLHGGQAVASQNSLMR